MKMFMRGTGVMVVALALICGACGPGDTEADIEVTTRDSGDDPDTVVRETPVVVEGIPDTVIRRDTVVKRSVDTVMQRDTVRVPTVSAAERGRIDAWLRANDATLNEYGDAEGTVYTGGTPLFDERTGRTITRYEYIVRQHPDKPWMRPLPTPSQPRPSQPVPPSPSQPVESRPRR